MKKPRRMITATLLLLSAPFVWAAGQLLEDVSPAKLTPSVLQGLPLDPARRARLEEAVKTRNYTRAETLLVEEIERNPKSSQLLTLLARIFFLDGKYLNSAVALKKAEALSPLDDGNRFTLAMSYIILDHRDWARPELERLARSDPKNALYPYWLSRLDYDAMQFNSAIAQAQKAIALEPTFAKAHDNLGLCHEALGQHDEAIRSYREAIRLNRERPTKSPWPALNLGALLVKLDRLEEAESYLRESLRYDPRFPRAHYQLALLLEKQKKDPEAIEELKLATAHDPSYPEPHFVLGRIYRKKGDTKNAETEWNTFQKLRKEQPRERPR